MKTFIFLAFLVGTLFFSSCNRTPQTNVLSSAAADSLVLKWNKAWNDKNVDSVMNLIANDAFLVINKKVISGRDSIRKLFVMNNIGYVKNLQIKKITCKVEKKFTWYCGSLSHLVVRHDSVISNEKGNIIFTWKPQPDNSWKLAFISIQ